MENNLTLGIDFQGSIQMNGVPAFNSTGIFTVGGYLSTGVKNVGKTFEFGCVLSCDPDDPEELFIGIPTGAVYRGILLNEQSIRENAPARPTYPLLGTPVTAGFAGAFWYKKWTKTAANAIEPVIGAKVIGNKTTGAIEFLAAISAVPEGWELLPAVVMQIDSRANGVCLYFQIMGADLSAPMAVLPAPILNPATYEGAEAQSVSITHPITGVEIRYTDDASEPDQTSNLYTEAIAIAATTTLKVKVYKSGYHPSATVAALYTITE